MDVLEVPRVGCLGRLKNSLLEGCPLCESGRLLEGLGISPARLLQSHVLSPRQCSLWQDFLISFKMIHDAWASKKITHEVARELALQSRCLGADKLVHLITWTEEREQSEHICRKADALRVQLETGLTAFRPSRAVVEWQRQYREDAVETALRFKSLLLAGKSRSGKTRKAISIFGHTRSLVVNCQGLGSNLPSLRAFSRDKHLCIIFDECSCRQVLANKLVFQAGVDPVTLGQSACNAHAYSVWLHAVPLILCSNDFQLHSRPEERLTVEEEAWLEANIIDASLPDGEVWYECAGSDRSLEYFEPGETSSDEG